MKVAILGGGISGVAAARFLAEAGAAVDIFEKDAQPGGLMRSRETNGYRFDLAGGHILFSKNAWFNAFVDTLFAGDELVASERDTKILFRGRFVHYPFENGIADLEPEERLRCVKGYLEAWCRREGGAKVPDNFHDWILYRLGQGIGDSFMFPYNRKIWKADLREMGIDWVEGRVPEAPLDDILRAAMGQRTEGYKHQIHFRYPRRGGFEEVFRRVASPVAERIRAGVAVERVERRGSGFAVNGTAYDQVVSTIPLPVLATLLDGLDSTTREAARALKHRSVTSFLFGIDAESVLPYSWLYLPHEEQGPANRVTCLSNYSPENAPPGFGSIQPEVTHDGPLRVDTAYLETLRDHMHQEKLLNKDRVTVMDFHSNEWGYILYDKDFTRKRRLAVDGVEAYGVQPLGRFGRFDYFNSDQCVVAARGLVDRMLARAGMGRAGLDPA